MTNQEELTYLFGILSEASKWTRSEDDDRDSVRMEVEERIQRLLGNGGEPDENGVIQSVVHPDKAQPVDEREARRKEIDHRATKKYRETHTLAWFDGKHRFYKNADVRDIMMPNGIKKHVHKDSREYAEYINKHPATQVLPAFPSMVNGGENG